MNKFTIFTLFLLLPTLYSNAQSVTLEEKIGQLLVVGFEGTEPSNSIKYAIEKLHIGGVILFEHNISNRKRHNIKTLQKNIALVDSLQSLAFASGTPRLFVAIDQEGGYVNRLKVKYGFPKTVSAEYLGVANSTDLTRKYARTTASTLKEIGININYAPCVDLAINKNNPVITKHERSFGITPQSVIPHAQIWTREHHKEGVLTSLKHFPGHGSSVVDSHLGFTDITETWNEIELEPYREMIDNGYKDIVIVGHLYNSNIDTQHPASLSKLTIDILRNNMKFKGVIAIDDMNMGAIANNYSFEESLELALNAGVDMIIISHNHKFKGDVIKDAVQIIKDLIANNKVSVETIDKAYKRIKKLKKRI